MCRMRSLIWELIRSSKLSPVNGLFICHFIIQFAESDPGPRVQGCCCCCCCCCSLRLSRSSRSPRTSTTTDDIGSEFSTPKTRKFMAVALIQIYNPSVLVNYEKYKLFKSIWPRPAWPRTCLETWSPCDTLGIARAMIDWSTDYWMNRAKT